jgi:hypothetical protein
MTIFRYSAAIALLLATCCNQAGDPTTELGRIQRLDNPFKAEDPLAAWAKSRRSVDEVRAELVAAHFWKPDIPSDARCEDYRWAWGWSAVAQVQICNGEIRTTILRAAV